MREVAKKGEETYWGAAESTRCFPLKKCFVRETSALLCAGECKVRISRSFFNDAPEQGHALLSKRLFFLKQRYNMIKQRPLGLCD